MTTTLTPAPGPEIYIGLITPLGAMTDALVDALDAELRHFSYAPRTVRYSAILARGETVPSYADDRTKVLIRRGNNLAERYGRDAVAKIGMQEIRAIRAVETGEPGGDRLLDRTAWIFRSLKRPEEITLLQQTYGEAFFTLAVHTTQEAREERLASELRMTRPTLSPEDAEARARAMIQQDEHEERLPHGQNVRKAFPMADVVLPGHTASELVDATRRFVQLLFGVGGVPTHAEHAMYVAEGTAAMSSSLSRKVGAALTTRDGEIVSTGANEVPKAGGGQYGSEQPGARDTDRGVDYSTVSLRSLVADTVVKLAEGGWLDAARAEQARRDRDALASDAIELLREEKAELMDIIEFQRSVHAEMAALLAAARRGQAVEDTRLYVTTYPCHLCAKEIVAAGVERVFYIEPYPKSRAEAMYGESVRAQVEDEDEDYVAFEPFVGVTPRAYRRLFETQERYRRKDAFGRVTRPDPSRTTPKFLDRFPLLSIPGREVMALDGMPSIPDLEPREES